MQFHALASKYDIFLITFHTEKELKFNVQILVQGCLFQAGSVEIDGNIQRDFSAPTGEE